LLLLCFLHLLLLALLLLLLLLLPVLLLVLLPGALAPAFVERRGLLNLHHNLGVLLLLLLMLLLYMPCLLQLLLLLLARPGKGRTASSCLLGPLLLQGKHRCSNISRSNC
jgi:hypothetical protein